MILIWKVFIKQGNRIYKLESVRPVSLVFAKKCPGQANNAQVASLLTFIEYKTFKTFQKYKMSKY